MSDINRKALILTLLYFLMYFLTTVLGSYLTISFAYLSFDPSEWGGAMRFIFGVVVVLFSTVWLFDGQETYKKFSSKS